MSARHERTVTEAHHRGINPLFKHVKKLQLGLGASLLSRLVRLRVNTINDEAP